jgi:hypothetical protein
MPIIKLQRINVKLDLIKVAIVTADIVAYMSEGKQAIIIML